MLTKQFLEVVAQLGPSVKNWPRRQPGLLMIGGKVLRYADLHSFYHQARQIFGERLYDFRCGVPAPRILDCGAHIGLASLFFKEQFPAARIEAFEADAELADTCRKNLAAFGVDVGVVQAAVWTHDRGVSFATTHDDAGHVVAGSGGDAVPSLRLKTLLEAERVDFLKLDVEGAEFDLIADCGDSLDNVDRLVIEVHAMGGEQAQIGHLLKDLEVRGFRYVLSDLHPAVWAPSSSPPPFSFCRTEKFIVSVFAWHRRVAT